MQGTQLQGLVLQGTQAQGMTMQGFQFASGTLNGAPLNNLRIQQGQLAAEQNGTTLQGTALVNAHVFAQIHNTSVSPPTTATVEYEITDIEPEDPMYDPTNTGATFLYSLSQNVDGSGNWQSACATDSDGRSVAIPLSATWDDSGARVESSSLFTFSCTTGVIAKCYRWGYRPWVTGFGDLVSTHWACTRLARADYCGDGTTHTHDGTEINAWDNLPSPGPIMARGTTPLGMVFEAGWNTSGAVCLSHARWLQGGSVIAQACPTRLIGPGLGILGGTVCDTVAQVLGVQSNAELFNQSDLNINLDLL